MTRFLLCLTPVLFGLSILWLGQDISWDLRNYHYYNPFAFLNGRMGHDVAVAHVATYYNPLIYIPFYWAVTWLPFDEIGEVRWEFRRYVQDVHGGRHSSSSKRQLSMTPSPSNVLLTL